MKSLLRQLRSEWVRGRGRPVEKYTGAIVIVLGVMIPIIMVLISSRNAFMRKSALETLAFPSSLRAARTMAALVGPFWAAALGSNIVGAEYQYGTWPWLLVRSSSRLRLVLIKLVSVASRVVALTVVGIGTFVGMAAAVCTLTGAPIAGESMTLGQMAIPFVGMAGAMAFAAAIGLTLTVVTRSVAFGTLTGALAQPLFSAIRFKETAPWIPYVHLENLQSRLLTGQPSPFLKQAYEFQMSGRASAGVLGLELLVVLGIALVVFRRQEIVY
jgi:ABC-type transport system involved in multi-copper enzyme maturation permease subunit